MLLWLIHWFGHSLGHAVPSAFSYTSTRMILSASIALLFSILLGPFCIRLLHSLKIGQKIRSEDFGLISQLHAKKQETPTMGGVLILSAMLLSLLVCMDLTHPFTFWLLFTTLWLGGLGAYDDLMKMRKKNSRGLSPKRKLLGQAALGAFLALYLFVPGAAKGWQEITHMSTPVVKEPVLSSTQEVVLQELTLSEYASLIYMPFFKEPLLRLTGLACLFGALLSIFVVVAASNAVNLTDGLDGLASGCVILVALCLALFAFFSNHAEMAPYLNLLYIEGSGEIAIYLSALMGACLGFLWYNGHPAQLFMGDTGSLALGGVIGVSAVLLRRELLLGLIGGVFVAETLSVILQVGSYRLRNKQRIFLCTPLHHHFEYKGWHENTVVLRFWIVGLLFALLGLASLKFP